MNGLSSVQVEQLKQIGDYLLQVREQQGVSLEKVAKDTFIPLRLLRALEVGETERLPEPVYIKGFIRRYADLLGLDGMEIADAFEVDTAPVTQPPVEQTESTGMSLSEPAIAPVTLRPQPRRDDHSQRTGFPIAGFVALGIAAIGILSAIALAPMASSLLKANSTKSAPETAAPTTSNSSTGKALEGVNAKPESSATNQAAPTTSAANSASNTPVQVDISLTDRSWMEVVADGKVKFEGILAKGEQRTWKAKNNLKIRAGNAGAVLASHNQGAAKPLGQLGAVVDASFSPKNETIRP